MIRSCLVVLVTAFGLVASGGCQRSRPQVAPAEPQVLPVSKPVQREVTDYFDFTGRTDAVKAVDIRPRVTGYLIEMPFKEGSEVKKGELLFRIDPAPYQAQYDQAESQVALNKASLQLARTVYQRDQLLLARKAISQQELDQDKATLDEAEARVKVSQASLEVYKLNLGFTKVTSPIDGMVSRYYLTVGNLVNQDQTLLTTVVSLDPMYVYFDMDEPTLLRVRRARNAGAIKVSPTTKLGPAHLIVQSLGAQALPSAGAPMGALVQRLAALGVMELDAFTLATKYPVLMGLSGEEGFPHKGTIDFVNNQVNPATGSIAIRGVFDNPKPEGGTRLLSPGMFVRVRLPIGQPHPALLIIDRAIGSDQGLKFVYVVDAENKVQYRKVKTGALQEDGLRVIIEGLSADDRVLVGGLPQVRARMQIQPEPTAMPTLAQAK